MGKMGKFDKKKKEKMMPLEESLAQSERCIELLEDNRFGEAVELAAKHAETSLFHSHCRTMILYIKAYLSLETEDIENAKKASIQSNELCNVIRPPSFRDNAIVKFFLNPNYDKYSETELHVELVRIEQVVFTTLMEFILDQSFFSFLKSTYRMRLGYTVFQLFGKQLEKRNQWSSKVLEVNFRAGTLLGRGIFNQVFAVLPARLVSLLSLIGYTASFDEGIKQLCEACNTKDSLRSFFAQIFLAIYECYFDQIFNPHLVPVTHTKVFIEKALEKFPRSLWYLAFKSRMASIEHNVEEALHLLEQGLQNAQIDIKEVQYFYYWDIMWNYALLGKWTEATDYASLLVKSCAWSSATLHYLKAAFLSMHLENQLFVCDKKFNELTNIRNEIDLLLREVPKQVKNYADRHLPYEEFIFRKVVHYENGVRLLCPVYELFILYNMLIYVEGEERYVGSMVKHVEQCIRYFRPKVDSEEFLLLKLIQGVGHRFLARYEEAKICLLEVVQKEELLVHNPHVAWFAALELAITSMRLGELDQVKPWLVRSRNAIDGHPTELLIRFRGFKASRLLRQLLHKQQQQSS